MTQTVPPLRLHHVGTSVPDLDAAVAWYRDVLGFVPDHTYAIPHLHARAAFLRLADTRIELFEVAGSAPMAPADAEHTVDVRRQGLKHFALATPDLDASMRALEARGVEVLAPAREVPDSGGDRWVFFRDLNGLLIELYQAARP